MDEETRRNARSSVRPGHLSLTHVAAAGRLRERGRTFSPRRRRPFDGGGRRPRQTSRVAARMSCSSRTARLDAQRRLVLGAGLQFYVRYTKNIHRMRFLMKGDN